MGKDNKDESAVAETPQPKCTCGTPLEKVVIKGGIWLGKGKGFDTTPKELWGCPKCDAASLERKP